MALPQLNLYSRQMLTGICYRILSGGADARLSDKTRRRIELLQAECTEMSLRSSSMRVDLQIAGEKLRLAESACREASLDLELFCEQHPKPPKPKGWFARRQPEPQELAKNRKLLESALADEQNLLVNARKKHAQIENEASQLEKSTSDYTYQKQALVQDLRRQLAAQVLGLAAEGDFQSAESTLHEARAVLRADPYLGLLRMLVALAAGGANAGLAAIQDSALAFGQAQEPLRKLAEGLVQVWEGKPLDRETTGVIQPGQFTTIELRHLYQAARVLGGWPPENSAISDSLLTDMLGVFHEYLQQSRREPGSLDYRLLKKATENRDLVATVASVHTALDLGQLPLAGQLTGVSQEALGGGGSLWEMAGQFPCSNWPQSSLGELRAILCCQVLLVAKGSSWGCLDNLRQESYGWPKSDFLWWVLSEVQGDPGLLRNLKGNPDSLVPVTQL